MLFEYSFISQREERFDTMENEMQLDQHSVDSLYPGDNQVLLGKTLDRLEKIMDNYFMTSSGKIKYMIRLLLGFALSRE